MSKFPELHKAILFATERHIGQDRKYTEVPYICHPLAVMEIVRSVTDNEAMLCAAVLHDVVEDTPTKIEEVHELFGNEVGELVDWLSDVSKPEDGNRESRKAIDRQHTADATPEAKTIKLADLIHNAESIMANDHNFATVFMKEKALLLDVLKQGDTILWQRAFQLVQKNEQSLLDHALKKG